MKIKKFFVLQKIIEISDDKNNENNSDSESDQVKEFEWFMKAAECNYTYGQYEVGKFFHGTKKDIVNAIY
ncbi:hypothetical protein Glove_78g68 [Diversispora epigaea]|uniref:Uncharacterized protein n=1 Tax=Diversispora epigaea TaxID=1348612 RepID=A0A397JAW8_9GLOM|nr:hypothetical protein Glove_78g68 [Diversispora epigaea]